MDGQATATPSSEDTPSATISETRADRFTRLASALRLPAYTVVDDGVDPEHYTVDGAPWCSSCGGSRWQKPRDFDPARVRVVKSSELLVRCPDCHDVLVTENRNRLARVAGLSDAQRLCTFQALKPVPGISPVVAALSKWAATPEGWIVVHGVPGSGKTHLTLAVANVMIHHEREVFWWYMPDIVSAYHQQVADHEPDVMSELLTEAHVLILDDLGAARWGDFICERLERVMDRRYRDRTPTLMTMIGDPASFRVAISDSIGRRMQDTNVCQVIENTAKQFVVRG